MRRREFIFTLTGAMAWPLAARALEPAMPVVGFLHSGSPEPFAFEVEAFRRALAASGYVDGQNVAIEFRWADGKLDRLPALAADLVGRQVAVIAAIGGDVTAKAAKAATATIPIVFQNGSDPVKSGLVASLNRPGGNVTGVSLFAGTVDSKRLELLRELLPHAALIAVLNNQLVAESESRWRQLEEAARGMGVKLMPIRVGNDQEVEAAFATLDERKADGVFIDGSPFFLKQRAQLVALASRHALPATYAWRQFVDDGGLMSYGASLTAATRQTVDYTSRILKGAKPADLPVVQPTKFELVINLKTAKALQRPVPDKLLALADEVIE